MSARNHSTCRSARPADARIILGPRGAGKHFQTGGLREWAESAAGKDRVRGSPGKNLFGRWAWIAEGMNEGGDSLEPLVRSGSAPGCDEGARHLPPMTCRNGSGVSR